MYSPCSQVISTQYIGKIYSCNSNSHTIAALNVSQPWTPPIKIKYNFSNPLLTSKEVIIHYIFIFYERQPGRLGFGLVLWCLTTISTISQLYRGCKFYWWRKPRTPEENHRPAASHWQALSHSVVSNTSRHERDSNSGDRHCLHREL